MARRKELRYLTVALEDGFSGTGAIDDAAIIAGDTTFLVDASSLDLHDEVTIVPVGARFTTEGITTIRTVTAQNASAVWTVTIGADTTGSYTLTFEGATTASLMGTDNAAAVLAALNALSNVEPGDLLVSGTGTAMDPFRIEAAGQYDDVADLSFSGTPTSLDNFAVATVESGGSTWSLTFSPAIASGSVPTDEDEITFLPQRVTMKIGSGNITHSENQDPQFDTDRGILDGVRLGTEQPMDVTTSFVYNWLRASSGQPITPYEAINRIGGAANWHNAALDPCEPYCFNLVVIDTPPCGSEQAEVIRYPRVYPTQVQTDVEQAQVSLTAKCNATKPEVTREDVSTL